MGICELPLHEKFNFSEGHQLHVMDVESNEHNASSDPLGQHVVNPQTSGTNNTQLNPAGNNNKL